MQLCGLDGFKDTAGAYENTEIDVGTQVQYWFMYELSQAPNARPVSS